MSELEHFDIVVFGGGKAGKTLAMQQSRVGRRVALIEAGMIGGSCINIACIPTKALVKSAHVAALMHGAGEFGSRVHVGPTDMGRVARRTAEVVAGMIELNRSAFQASGLELVLGWGRFVAPRVIEVERDDTHRRLTADRIYLDLGTRADIPDIPGLHEAAPLTHVEALLLTDVPAHLLILGGGYIGIEMAQAFRRFGAEVTIIERGLQLAAREDGDVATAIQALLEVDGIRLAFGMRDVTVSGRSGDQVVVASADGRQHVGSHLLVAAGRRPMTSNIGLDQAGVELTDSGYIRTDAHLSTTASGIWALGEVAGSPMFTHAALDDYRVARSGIEGGNRVTTGRLVPYCVFIEPEFARVGLSESEARERRISYRIARLPMSLVPRARTLSEETGFMKALVSADSEQILGFAMLGAQAGEVMAVVQVAMLGRLPYTLLRDGILAHPTLAEGLNALFEHVEPGDC